MEEVWVTPYGHLVIVHPGPTHEVYAAVWQTLELCGAEYLGLL